MTGGRTFIVEVTIEKRFRVVIGGDGSARIEGENDEDAAAAIAGSLGEAQMPPYITVEDVNLTIETVRGIVDANCSLSHIGSACAARPSARRR